MIYVDTSHLARQDVRLISCMDLGNLARFGELGRLGGLGLHHRDAAQHPQQVHSGDAGEAIEPGL